MGKQAQYWVARVVLAAVFGVWAGLAAEPSTLRIALAPEVHAPDHQDPSGGPASHGVGDEFDLTELEDSDDDSAHRALGLVIADPEASPEHALHHGDVRQHPAVEPETPPPRA